MMKDLIPLGRCPLCACKLSKNGYNGCENNKAQGKYFKVWGETGKLLPNGCHINAIENEKNIRIQVMAYPIN